jgi:hypothetical protein
MSTESPVEVRRLALVLASDDALGGAPPGVDAEAFARCCLLDSYEVLADLVGVASGVAGGGGDLDDLLWPGALRPPPGPSLRALATSLADQGWTELVLVSADVPDLPGLVVAKVFRALRRADVCVAPERGGTGCVALGVRLPWPSWLDDLDLDANPVSHLRGIAPDGARVAVGPDWHRLRTSGSVARLDPGLEGWELTRALLSGASLVPR